MSSSALRSTQRTVTLLVVVTLGCQTPGPGEGSGTPEPLPTVSPTQTALTIPSPEATPEPPQTASPTVLPATITPLPTADPLQLKVFEELWDIVNREYLYPDYNGLDWDAIGEEYRGRIALGLSPADFYAAMREMIHRLEDDHSSFLSPSDVIEEDAEYAGSRDYVGIGVLVTPVPERQRAVILVAFPGSPAEAAGLKPRDGILAVDGLPILDGAGEMRTILRGPEGSLARLTVQTPGQEPRQVTIPRRHISGPVPVPYTVLLSPAGQKIGHVLLVTLADSTIDDQLEAALLAMMADSPLDGLIVDNRQNVGGADVILTGILGMFTEGLVGHFVSRTDQRPLRVAARPVGDSRRLPLVILVGQDTVSFGEIFAGVLQDQGRAYLIGEPTQGNVETLWGYDLADGSRAWIAHDTFQPLNQPGQNWETRGVLPDLYLAGAWDEYEIADDPLVRAALGYLDEIP